MWTWCMQPTPVQKDFDFREYDTAGKPSSTLFRRYGHRIEINPEALLFATSKGNLFTLTDDVNGGILVLNKSMTMHVGTQFTASTGTADITVRRNATVDAKRSIGISTPSMAIYNSKMFSHATKAYMLSIGETSMIYGADGQIMVVDGAGSTLMLDGEGSASISNASGDFVLVGKNQLTLSRKGSSVVVTDDQVTVNALKVMLNSPNVSLGAASPFTAMLTEKFLALFNAHVHRDSGQGPPAVALLPIEVGSFVLRLW